MSSVVKMNKEPFDEGCVFCRMAFDPDLSSEPTNEILYSGDHHYVISGLGAWMPGYVLLVTHQHFDNFSLAPDESQAEFRTLYAQIEKLFLQEFGEVTIFEHGAVGDGKKKAGGCINHAHVHFVARNVDLCRELGQQFRPIAISDSPSVRHLPRLQRPYLYVKQQGAEGQAFLVERPLASQFLRQKVASMIQMDQYWDYKLHPFNENILATIEMFRGRIGGALPSRSTRNRTTVPA